MFSRRHVLFFAIALGTAAANAGAASACAVTTTIRVQNQTAQTVREVYVSAPDRGVNQLPSAGLAPGQSATITLPSCIGRYDVSAVFADGRRTDLRDLDATRIRGLDLR